MNEMEQETNLRLDKMKQQLKAELKIELSQKGSQMSPPVGPNIQLLGARVSTKGSNAEIAVNPSGEEHVGHMLPTMGLYVQRQNCTHLVALGKVYQGGCTIHGVAYADDVVRVSVEKIVDAKSQVPFPTSKIQYVWQALDTFIAWPTNLVKIVSNEVIFILFNMC